MGVVWLLRKRPHRIRHPHAVSRKVDGWLGSRETMSRPAADAVSVGDLVDEHGGLFSDRFVLCSRLGSGCSSTVYVVKDITTGEQAACKLAQRRPNLRWSQLKARGRP